MEKYNLDNNEEGRRKRPRMKRAEGIEFNNQNSSENQHRRFFKKKNGKRLKGSEEIIQNKINRRKSRQAPPEPKYDGTTRLNKYISNAGICSRRDADKLIEAGAVSVNGEVITVMGYRVKEGDVVTYAGQVLRSEPKRYFLLNKPKGSITTLDDLSKAIGPAKAKIVYDYFR